MWQHDNIEIMFDGDHTGGQFDGFSVEAFGEDGAKRAWDAQAQMYVAIAASPTGQLVYNLGAADPWVSRPPWAEVTGVQTDTSPHYSLIEGAITPWDDLDWHGPGESRASLLEVGRMTGLEISVVDIDEEPGVFQGYHSLWGQRDLWQQADNFVDAILLCATCDLPAEPTAVASNSWARIKASLQP